MELTIRGITSRCLAVIGLVRHSWWLLEYRWFERRYWNRKGAA